MAFVFKVLILAILVIYSAKPSVSESSEVPDGKASLPLLERICGGSSSITLKSKILLCLFCKGLDPSCFNSTTTTAAANPGTSSSSAATSPASAAPGTSTTAAAEQK